LSRTINGFSLSAAGSKLLLNFQKDNHAANVKLADNNAADNASCVLVLHDGCTLQ